jgi:hypothetical protein
MEGLDLSPNFGLKFFLTDLQNALGIKTGPIADLTTEAFKKDYPIASAIIADLSDPNTLASAGLEGIALAKLPKELSSPVASAAVEKFKKYTAKKYIEAIQKDPSLSQALKDSGKFEDVIDYVSSNYNQLITPFNKEKGIDFLTGKTTTSYDPDIGMQRTVRDTDAGIIGQRMAGQEDILDKIPTSQYSLEPVEARVKAKGLLDNTLLESQRSRAEKLIDEAIPLMDYSPEKIAKISKALEQKDLSELLDADVFKEQLSAIESVQSKKNKITDKISSMDEMVKNPAYREDLQWLAELPVVEGTDDVFPRNYVTNTVERGVPEFDPMRLQSYSKEKPRMDITTSEFTEQVPRASSLLTKNQDMLDIAQGKNLEKEFIQNQAKLDFENKMSAEIDMLNQEIEQLMKGNVSDPKKYNKLSAKIKQRNAAREFYVENFDPSAPTVDSYKYMIDEMNQMPAGQTTQLRRKGNRLIEGSKIGQSGIDAGAEQAAGMALMKQGAMDERVAMSGMPQADIDTFNTLKREQEMAITARDLIDRNRVVKDNSGRAVPVGDLSRGLLREGLSTLPEFGGPIMFRGVESAMEMVNPAYRLGKGAALSSSQADMQRQNKPESIMDFVPRGQVISDPRLRSAAIDHVTKDKINTPARNADRLMKLINESIFED